jgi:toxin HigB-1
MKEHRGNIRTFRQKELKSFFEGSDDGSWLSQDIHRSVRRKLSMLNSIASIQDLRQFPGLHLEKLKGPLKDFHSIRLDLRWRLIFRWLDDGAYDVEVSIHYGD